MAPPNAVKVGGGVRRYDARGAALCARRAQGIGDVSRRNDPLLVWLAEYARRGAFRRQGAGRTLPWSLSI